MTVETELTHPDRANKIRQVADRFQVSDREVWRWIAEGKIKAERQRDYIKAADEAFEKSVAHENPETVKRAAAEVVEIAKQFGVSREALAEIWNTPVMRHPAFQTMMLMAGKYAAAQREVVNKVDRSAAPVQRPGTTGNVSNDTDLRSLSQKLSKSGSIDDAFALITARRARR